ncbi:MAG: AAC(3) family N-acetyltransferase [Caldilineaceae bacterium]|nr:AAC(3) family N-acetyltransferase [Caldilineaceae bacterium]
MGNPQTQERIGEALRVLGLPRGALVFVHSSMSSIGYVEGGAEALVDAFLQVLGPAGTLAVPTFTFSHSRSAAPVFDPALDPSEMGRLTEETRTRPGAQRSCHLLHSVAALGAHAEKIAARHGPSAWAEDGPFWKLRELDACILLLGVPYLRCTFFHLLEQQVQVPYRQWREVEAQIREPDGSQRPLPTLTFGPKPGFVGNDFNRLGMMLEERGHVMAGSVGNAVVRLFRARDAFEVGMEQYQVDPDLFLMKGREYARLGNGVLTDELHNEKWVLDPAKIYRRQ